MRILVFEGDLPFAEGLQTGLLANGYVVDIALDGMDGCRLALDGDYDLVVVNLPSLGPSRFDFLHELKRKKDSAILVISEPGTVEDRVQCFAAGADDCVQKPFDTQELIARIEAILRRGGLPSQVEPVLCVRDLSIDLVRQRAYRDGHRLDLTVQEFSIITTLTRRAGQPVSRHELVNEVWGRDSGIPANLLDVAIRRLRTKLDDPFTHRLLHTVRGLGYVLAPEEEAAAQQCDR